MDSLESRVAKLEQTVSTIKLHLENITDKNISILAENHLMLVQKLNQAVEYSDKNRIYEVKVNYLEEDVKFLKSEVEKINARIA